MSPEDGAPSYPWLCRYEVDHCFRQPDERLAALPEISRHDRPQDSPQEYECGCVAITRITDRDYRELDSNPFEMRLAIRCDSASCELVALGVIPTPR